MVLFFISSGKEGEKQATHFHNSDKMAFYSQRKLRFMVYLFVSLFSLYLLTFFLKPDWSMLKLLKYHS